MTHLESIHNSHLLAYRAGRLDEIPDHLFQEVVRLESENRAPKPDKRLVEARLARLGVSVPAPEAEESEEEPMPAEHDDEESE